MNKKRKLKVIELFAGVGGFRLGLEGWEGKSSLSNYTKKLNSRFEVIWSNQFEPSTNRQHANEVYFARWGKTNHSDRDIEKVIENNFESIPKHDLLVGGFPCQDYSVATTLKSSKGLIGKKGVLWWSIYSILKNKGKDKPSYLLLENVDRLLVSPASQRGRDFAVILSCLNELDYAVEWKVINAAEYGMPQRRRRVYILAYHKSTDIYKKISKEQPNLWITTTGIFAETFPSKKQNYQIVKGTIEDDKEVVTNEFNKGKKLSPFKNSGLMIKGTFYSIKTVPDYIGKQMTLDDIIVKPLSEIPDSFFIDSKRKLKQPIIKVQLDGRKIIMKTELDKWKYLKGSKNEMKFNSYQGYEYKYSEGNMNFLDLLDKPSRTIITGEGGASPSRFKHVIEQENVKRRLLPMELERLNMFPDNHTKLNDLTDAKRAFFMGNALVVGVIEKIGLTLSKYI